MTMGPSQEHRTFFITTVTWGRRSLFHVERNALLLLDIFKSDRQKGRYRLHAFVIMPDHLHLLLTPAQEVSLERSMQFIKGGLSFRLKTPGEVWQRGFTEHRIQDAEDYRTHAKYIAENPVRARLAGAAEAYPYSFISKPDQIDPIPAQFLSGRG